MARREDLVCVVAAILARRADGLDRWHGVAFRAGGLRACVVAAGPTRGPGRLAAGLAAWPRRAPRASAYPGWRRGRPCSLAVPPCTVDEARLSLSHRSR